MLYRFLSRARPSLLSAYAQPPGWSEDGDGATAIRELPALWGAAVASERPCGPRRADVRMRMNVRGPAGQCLRSMSVGGSETPAF